MTVGLICTQNGLPRNTVSPPKPTISAVDSHSIGDTRPNFTRENTSAATAATTKAPVPRMIAAMVPAMSSPPGSDSLNTARKTINGP